MLAPAPGDKILDVGAGRGAVAMRVLRSTEGVEVYAVDPNEKRISSAQRDFPELKSSVAGAEGLPFPDSFFDKAFTTMALHHYSDLDSALREIWRVLKPGGSFVILEVDPRSPKGRLFRLFGRIDGEHMNLMSAGQLASRVGAAAGFKITRSASRGSDYLIQATRA